MLVVLIVLFLFFGVSSGRDTRDGLGLNPFGFILLILMLADIFR